MPQTQQTLLLVKPDGVKRGLTGEILNRIEDTGLKVVALKMVNPSREQLESHYSADEDWLRSIGENTKENYEEYGIDAKEEIGSDDPLEIGKKVREWLMEYLSSAPVVAMVLEGNNAVDNLRMLVGDTMPRYANPGTIRGDYSIDDASLANPAKRAIKNLVHASGEEEEAKEEIEIWFSPEEIYSYKRAEEEAMF